MRRKSARMGRTALALACCNSGKVTRRHRASVAHYERLCVTTADHLAAAGASELCGSISGGRLMNASSRTLGALSVRPWVPASDNPHARPSTRPGDARIPEKTRDD